MIQYSSYHQLATSQLPRRKPTIGAPDIMLTPEPTASLKRRSHIRRTSRAGMSPTESTFNTAPPEPEPRLSRPRPAPLVTAFTRSITASSATLTPITRRPTLMDPVVEWRDSPRYQTNVSPRAEVSRRSTIASVYSMPSAGGHESRRSTQENYVADWSFVDRALQNRALAPSSSHSLQGPTYHSTPSNASLSRSNTRSQSTAGDLCRTNTAHVQSLLLERRRRYDILPESPRE